MVAQSDEQLLVRVQEGDEAAFRELYRRYAPRLMAAARRSGASFEEASAALVEAFTRIWRAAPRFEAGRATAQSWVVTIAHRAMVQRLRERRRETEPAPAEPPERGRRARGLPEPLRARTGGTPGLGAEPEPRQLLDAAFFQGRTHAELADAAGISPQVARQLLEQGLAELAAELAGEGR